MTDREKMVEEMVKDIIVSLGTKCLLNIGGNCIDCKYVDEDNADHDCQSVLVANELTDKGYRKIPDNAVVLTKEEYERLASYISEERAREIFHEETEKLKEKIRKDTEREILKKLNGFRFVMYDEGYEVASWTCGEDDVKQFAKEIGVEGKE